MSDPIPPAEPQGTIIQVTSEPPKPKYVIDDSPLKASIITIMVLVSTGLGFSVTFVRLLSAHDLNGIRAFLMQDDVKGWISTVVVLLTPSALVAWRAVVAWFRKQREVEISSVAPNNLVMTKAEHAQALAAASPSSRARETATPATRLVDPSVLHRGGLAPVEDDRASVLDLIGKSSWRDDTTTLDRALGDALAGGAVKLSDQPAAAPVTPLELDADAFDQLYHGWVAEGGARSLADYLIERGWSKVDDKWTFTGLPGAAS